MKNGRSNKKWAVAGLGMLVLTCVASVPFVFEANTTISSQEMNDNFVHFEAQIAALQSELGDARVLAKDGKRFSLNGSFVRTTEKQVGDPDLRGVGSSFDEDGKTTGAIEFGGIRDYQGAKAVCELLVGTDTAHFCTNEEMRRSAQLMENPLPSAEVWVSGGASLQDSETIREGSHLNLNDCNGWTSNSTARAGARWSGSPFRPGYGWCDSLHGVACCD